MKWIINDDFSCFQNKKNRKIVIVEWVTNQLDSMPEFVLIEKSEDGE